MSVVHYPATLGRLREEGLPFTKDGVNVTGVYIAKMNYLKCVFHKSKHSIPQ